MLISPLRRLDAEIQDCEARVRLHDARLGHSAQMMRERIRQAAGGRMVMVAGAAVGALGTAVWARKRRHAQRHAHHADYRSGYRDGLRAGVRGRSSAVPDMLQRWGPLLLPLASPLMNRKVAGFLVKLGVPLHVQAPADMPTVAQLDLRRYAGRWYEIARLPTKHEKRCSTDVTAEYELDEEGLRVVNRCRREDGSVDEAEGRGRVPDPAQPGQLEVTFAPGALQWLPFAWADYWVLFVDEDYRVALVGTPERDALWVLAREPSMPPADYEALKSLALRHGFDTDRLQPTPHRSPESATSAGTPKETGA